MRLKLFLTGLVLALCACSDGDDRFGAVDLTPLLARYTLSSNDSVPEGVAFDPRERVFYATSLQGASITRIDADGTESVFRAADGRASLVGIKVDASRRLLWVCARNVDAMDNRVWVFDLDSAQMRQEFLLGALATEGSCNDVALDANGTAYVTDSGNPNIYRLDAQSGEGSVLVSDPLLADITTLGLGLNGIAVTPDGSGLIAGRFAPASLFHIDLPAADTVTPIELSGDTLPPPDGIVFLDGDLYSVSDAAVSRVRPGAAFTTATVTLREQVSGLSTATVAEGALYVIKSEVTRSVLGQPLELPFEIFRVDTAAFED
jgi:sugar lactone lactonase YvrE